MTTSHEDNIDSAKNAVESLHNCTATFRESARVSESFEGDPVWFGVVHVFDIEGNPESDTCYAWSSPIEGSKKRRFYAVLKIPPVDSPAAAVRASIVADAKAGRGP